jgi:phytoene dehydrogenase-like protein
MAVAAGGPAALTKALVDAAKAAAADVRTGAEVARVTTRDGRVTGVALASGEEIGARQVVSGLDPKRTLLGLLEPEALGPTMSWEADNLRLGGSVSVVLLALAELPKFSGVDAADRLAGRILLAPSLRTLDRVSDAVKGGRAADEFALEATISAVADGTAASHTMSVLVQGTPYHRRDGNWDADCERLGDQVVKQLESVAPGIGKLVVGRRVLTPLDLEREYGLTEGHPMHGEAGLDQWFVWRPLFGYSRYLMPVDGLFLCGAGAHPGGGVTGEPGRLAAAAVLGAKAGN